MQTTPEFPRAGTQRPTARRNTITADQRRIMILARLDQLKTTEPPHADSMPFKAVMTLAADFESLRRLMHSKGPIAHVLRIGARVATAYGVDMATIDPMHGAA